MNDVNFAAPDRRLQAMFMSKSAARMRRVLVARPDSFFSLRFLLEIEEQDENDRPFRHDNEVSDRIAVIHAVGTLLFIALAALIGWLTI